MSNLRAIAFLDLDPARCPDSQSQLKTSDSSDFQAFVDASVHGFTSCFRSKSFARERAMQKKRCSKDCCWTCKVCAHPTMTQGTSPELSPRRESTAYSPSLQELGRSLLTCRFTVLDFEPHMPPKCPKMMLAFAVEPWGSK